jgi:membrane associated rhomboid family serine protease
MSLLDNLSNTIRTFTTSSSAAKTILRESRAKSALIWTCIGLNSLVFLSWQAATSPASTQERRSKFQRVRKDLEENFLLSTRNLREGRWWTLVTSAFSHVGFGHFLFNMIAFHQLSQILKWVPGLKAGRHLGVLILGSAVSASTAFFIHGSTLPNGDRRHGLGFSGVVSGVVTTAACVAPYQRMLFFGVVPVPLWLLGLGYAAYDTYAMDSGNSTVAHDAHVGGAVFGGLFYMVALRRFGGILPKQIR